MAAVMLLWSPPLAARPADGRPAPGIFSLYRPGTGPGRCEGIGFGSREEAEAFAARFGHRILGEVETLGLAARALLEGIE